MPKFYAFFCFVLLVSIPGANAVTKIWVGTDGDTWNTIASWNPAGVPLSTDDVVFTGFAGTVVLSNSPTIQSLNIINGSDVVFAGNAPARRITVSCIGCSTGVEGGSFATFSGTSGANACDLYFISSPYFSVDGTLTFTGGGNSDLLVANATMTVNGSLQFSGAGASRLLCSNGLTYVNGEIVYSGGGSTSGENTSNLFINGNAFYELAKNGGSVPNASWATSSTLKITGMIDDDPSFTNGAVLGNLFWSSPGQTVPAKPDVNLTFYQVDIFDTGASEVQVASTPANQTRTWTINGDYTQSGGTVNMSSGNNGIGRINFKGGNFFANMILTETGNGKGIVEFSGTQPQVAYFATVNNTIDVVVNTGEKVLLNTLLTINPGASFTLTSGSFVTSMQNLLTISAGATVIGGSVSSCVIGPMRKIGNTAITFPVGKGTTYAPLSITAPAAVTDTFTVEYFDDPYPNTADFLPPLVRVSHLEHWQLTGSAGAGPVQVGLHWLSGSASGINDLGSLTAAYFDGTDWMDIGGAASGTVTTGSVQSSAVAAFNRFTFGAKLLNANPLPIELKTFEVFPLRHEVELRWSTAQEKNNAFFVIERGTDGISFAEIGQTAGAGTSVSEQRYSFIDRHPAAGPNYYRLRQVDVDGQFSYSPIRSVSMGGAPRLLLFPSPVSDVLHIQLSDALEHPATWQAFDAGGRLAAAGTLGAETRNWELPVGELPEGIYLLRVDAGTETTTERFLKRGE